MDDQRKQSRRRYGISRRGASLAPERGFHWCNFPPVDCHHHRAISNAVPAIVAPTFAQASTSANAVSTDAPVFVVPVMVALPLLPLVTVDGVYDLLLLQFSLLLARIVVRQVSVPVLSRRPRHQ